MPDIPPEPAERSPQKKMGEAEKAKLRAFLTGPECPRKPDGSIDKAMAAKLTGLTYGCVDRFIARDAYFAAGRPEANTEKMVPGESALVDAPAPPSPALVLTDAQMREYQALIRQNKKMLAKDWERLGMTPEAGARMEHYIGLGAAPTGMILRATTGQLISNLELLDRIVKGDCERVLTGKLPQEVDKNGEPRDPELVEREWRHTVYSGMELQLKIFSHVHKVQALMARVMKDLQSMNGMGSKPDKGTYERPALEGGVSEREA